MGTTELQTGSKNCARSYPLPAGERNHGGSETKVAQSRVDSAEPMTKGDIWGCVANCMCWTFLSGLQKIHSWSYVWCFFFLLFVRQIKNTDAAKRRGVYCCAAGASRLDARLNSADQRDCGMRRRLPEGASLRYCRPQRPRVRALPPQISRKKGMAKAKA